MPKAYFIIFCFLLAIPVVAAVAVVAYVCFKASLTSGFIALGISLAVVAIAIIFMLYKIRHGQNTK